MSTSLTTTTHTVSVQYAKELIERYTDAYENTQSESDCLLNKSHLMRSQSFEKKQIIDLLNQDPNIIGLRCYFGMYDSESEATNAGKLVLVICAVDENGDDFNLSVNYDGPNPLILEDGQPCPPICPAPSKINCL